MADKLPFFVVIRAPFLRSSALVTIGLLIASFVKLTAGDLELFKRCKMVKYSSACNYLRVRELLSGSSDTEAFLFTLFGCQVLEKRLHFLTGV